MTVRSAFAPFVVSTHLDTSKATGHVIHPEILSPHRMGPSWESPLRSWGTLNLSMLSQAKLSIHETDLIAEAESSVSFVNRIGLSKANELLIFGKRKTAQELLECQSYNDIFPESSVGEFHKSVSQRAAAKIDGLVTDAVLKTKQLLRLGLKGKNDMGSVLLREGYIQAERFATRVPTERFARIARKEIRHKL